MSVIRPFRAFRPPSGIARDVASFPYDVIDSDEARVLARGNPVSFLHVGKPEIDMDPAIDVHDDRVYAKARENLTRFVTDGTLTRDAKPCLYLYQQKMGEHAQVGLVALCRVSEYENGLIKRHEFTRKDKEDDRTRHVTECNANAEPVFLTYRSVRDIDTIVDRATSHAPVIDIVTSDDIGHTLWVLDDDRDIEALVTLFAQVPALYVADGHHRTAAAVRHGQMMRAKNPLPRGDEPYEFFMAVIFPHDQLQIMDYNRVVKDLNGATPQQFMAKVEASFDVAVADGPRPTTPHTFGMYLGERWYRLRAREGTFPAHDPVRSLDVAILQDNLLAPILGIQDPRTDKRIDFVGGIRGTQELERRVQDGAAVAFSM